MVVMMTILLQLTHKHTNSPHQPRPHSPPLTPCQEVLGGACSTTMIATVRVGDFEGSAFVLDFIQVCVLPAFER